MRFIVSDIPLPLFHINNRMCKRLSFFFENTVFSIIPGNELARFSYSSDGGILQPQEITMNDYQWFLTALERFAIELHIPPRFKEVSDELIPKMLPRRSEYKYNELQVKQVKAKCGKKVRLVKLNNMKPLMREFLSEDREFIELIKHNSFDEFPKNLTGNNFVGIIKEQCSHFVNDCPSRRATTVSSLSSFDPGIPSFNNGSRIATPNPEGEDLSKNSEFLFSFFSLIPLLFVLFSIFWYYKKKKKKDIIRGKGKIDEHLIPLLELSFVSQQLDSFDNFRVFHIQHITAVLKALCEFLCYFDIKAQAGFDRIYKQPLEDAIECFQDLDNDCNSPNECKKYLEALKEKLENEEVGGRHFEKCCRDFLLLVVKNVIANCSLLMLRRLDQEQPYIDPAIIGSIGKKINKLKVDLFQLLSSFKSEHKISSILKIKEVESACIFCFEPVLDAHGFGYYCYMQRTDVSSVVLGAKSEIEQSDESLREKLMALLKVGLEQGNPIREITGEKELKERLKKVADVLGELQQVKDLVTEKNSREQGILQERKRTQRLQHSKIKWRYSYPTSSGRDQNRLPNKDTVISGFSC